ncbi:MMS19 nucleotide excision repair protein homolog isoform X2 [Orussus abietinus]|uniref:MMS19 nucleotide excision repair protein homolog isoform X2 n=1 Tax=Orussus abietinus TaxID=222816 RepID=UPI000C716300|nr:MMS19 nucleotide excision repair protein homolog isoform X2 [Orussus abietinus]
MASPTSELFPKDVFSTMEDDNAVLAKCQSIALDIQEGRIKFLAVVNELEHFLTNKDVNLREKGVRILSTTLGLLPTDFFNESELEFITLFYCDRMKDHHNILPAVFQGVLSIVQMSCLPQNAPHGLLTALFQHVQCQSQIKQDRRNVYLLFKTLIQKRGDSLKAMGTEFIYGFISFIDGERDPRNLMLLFNIIPIFAKEFPIGQLTEELFEVIACYFPVDFNSSGNEGRDITRDRLAEALAPCLYAIPEFAEFCLPLVIDKLNSALKTAKLDSLTLLSNGVSTFGAKGCQPHLDELWPLIRREIMPGNDLELKNASLKALGKIVETLSSTDLDREEFIEKILTDTKSSLCDVQLSLFWPAEKILEIIANTNKEACVQVLRSIIPLCLGQYSTKTSFVDKTIIMETINNFIRISDAFGFSIKSVPELAWTDLPLLYLNELNTEAEELQSKVLQGLIAQKSYLNDVHRATLYEVICKKIDFTSNEVETVCCSCLLAFATLYPGEVLNVVTEKLSIDVDITVPILTRRLKALSIVAKVPEIGHEVLPKIVAATAARDVELGLTALSCLCRLVAEKNGGHFDINKYLHDNCNVIERLLLSESGDTYERLHLISKICRSIVRRLDIESQQAVLNKYGTLVNKRSLESSVILLEGIITPLRPNVIVPKIDELLNNLCNLAIESSDVDCKNTACKLISVLINKMAEDEHIEKLLNRLRERIMEILNNSDASIEVTKAAATLHVWLTKALIMKGSRISQDLLNYHISILKHSKVGLDAAKEFQILTNRQEDSLTEENFCTIRIFFKQRIFQNLVQARHLFTSDSRENYLIAVTHLLEEVPTELLFMYLNELVSLLQESLNLHNTQLVLSTLIALKLLLDTNNEIFADQVQNFIPKLLNLSTYKEMNVRMAALECLTSYCTYPTSVIIVYKPDVLEKLQETIDDRKRLVRKVAVRARTRWFLVGSIRGSK